MPAETRRLTGGWEIASTEPGACAGPPAAAGLDWRAARSGPGGGLTAAGTLGDGDLDYDAQDWWFRVTVDEPPAGEGEEVGLALGGLATLAEVWVDSVAALSSESMYAAHTIDVNAGAGELVICCRALAPRLAERRRPRARWRTRVVAAPNLRFFRTMLLGRAPGFAPGPAVVGPWRPVSVTRRSGLVIEAFTLRTRLADGDGALSVSGRVRALGGRAPTPALTVTVAGQTAQLGVGDDGAFAGRVTVPGVRPWWPHTHGDPVLHAVEVRAGDELLAERRVGFRALESTRELDSGGLALAVNGVPVFCRGAVWTPPSLTDPDPGRDVLEPLLGRLRDAGVNMLRVVGTGTYESDDFLDLCDELGMLVWQDAMFANLDYPESDPEFMAAVQDELRSELARLAARPSLAVVCGSSEVAQQVAMLGLDPGLAAGPLYSELLPRLVAEAGIDAPYVPSAPWGGALPFRPDRGVANYFGVGAYLRPLSDARRAEVRFASECLAFANVGDSEALGAVLGPEWKAGVPRDTGAGWDFDDVRDHYLRELYGVDPMTLRYADAERYLALSRQVTGEVMAETFGEWRRGGSPCAGAIVLWAKDLLPGAGWGLLDAGGETKVALSHLRRALAPAAVWTTDEGLGGIAIHVANDGPMPLLGRLRVCLYRDGAVRVQDGEQPVSLAAHGALTVDAETILGRFLDAGWAYRFGPPVADAIVVSLHGDEDALLSQAFRFPTGWPLQARSTDELGLRAQLTGTSEDRLELAVASDRIAYGVRVTVPGWEPADDAFCLEPGCPRALALTPSGASATVPQRGELTALNAAGAVRIPL